ncbi:hypothetical protein M413DRAFT_442261 [Hebeloma cylindrosporum]|uniref:Uncharacterized protein n=1 Tax=Hebeloma cylindrosporum TaxID=76867 RepID=A0A0C3CPC4_HEBCY|nr:hypothetical protein M413DRAFT_442261 [Hebeloma cylindrosporum h7]
MYCVFQLARALVIAPAQNVISPSLTLPKYRIRDEGDNPERRRNEPWSQCDSRHRISDRFDQGNWDSQQV